MSLLKEAIQSLVIKGKITHEFEFQGMKFEMSPLTSEENLVSESMVDPDALKAKYKADTITTFRDTIEKHRAASLLSFVITKIDGKSPVDLNESLENQFKTRLEFRNELLTMNVVMFDHLMAEVNKCMDSGKKFYEKIEENVGK